MVIDIFNHGTNLLLETQIGLLNQDNDMFINPMWDNESQRLGKQKCSYNAYNIHVFSDLVGMISLLAFIFGLVSLLHMSWKFSLTIICSSVISAVVGNLLCGYSWRIVEKKNFKYDYQIGVVSWIENGIDVTYKYGDE